MSLDIGMDVNLDVCKKHPNLAPFADYFQGRMDGKTKDETGKSLAGLQKIFPAWNAESMLDGLSRLWEIGARPDGSRHIIPVYSQEKRRRNAFLEQVRLIWFPGESEKPYVILCAGGSYQSVCSMVEAFPAAAALIRAGYTAFVLNYRTDTGTGEAVMPKPLEDLAEAVKYVDTHRDEFGLKCGNYAAAGFSAGANLVNLWGLEHCGYRHYHTRKPDVLFCSYTVSSVKDLDPEKEKAFLETMFGKEYGRETLERYDVLSHLTKDYPPCYINACRDDEAVPVSQSERLHERLTELGVRNKIEIGKSGGHGYGIGRGTDVEGWLERALYFWTGR